jgi:hypothetical protein
MLNYLFRRFRPTIDLDVSRQQFRFRHGQVEVAFEPLCRFNAEGKFCAIGSESRSISDGQLVDFFADRHRRGQAWPHERALVLFCRYGLMSVLMSPGRWFVLRPSVRVTGSRELRQVLDRTETEILRRVLRNAGAASTGFPDVLEIEDISAPPRPSR